MYTISPVSVKALIEATDSLRDKALIALLADSGARRSEIANITVQELDLENRRIKVAGKGGKEGYLIFGDITYGYLTKYLEKYNPSSRLFKLTTQGLKTVLRRLEKKTGIKCNAHSFRRGFATELRRKGLSELDIAELGRWSSTTMVKRYSRAYGFDDAAKRYQSLI